MYRKTPKEIEDYLILQSKVLKASAASYDANTQHFNQKVFIQIAGVQETDIKKRAALINKPDVQAPNANDPGATLNSLELAKQISGTQATQEVALSSEEQSELLNKLATPEDAAAAIMALSLSTESKKAKEAITSEAFTKLNGGKILAAMNKLATTSILPKGQLNTTAADALVIKLLTRIQQPGATS